MKMISTRNSNRSGGYVSVAMVAGMAVMTTFSLALVFSHSIGSQEFQARAQVRADFTQKEDAVLRSLVAILPNKAIGAMQDGAASQAAALSWSAIFDEALALSNAEQAVDSVTLQGFGITDYVSANSGDHSISSSTSMVGPVVGNTGGVNGGTVASSTLLFDSRYSGKLPDPLVAPAAVMSADHSHPIISLQKTYSSDWTNDAQLDVAKYPLYNRIAYPNIRFGFKQAGEDFVAKRNWWAFSIRFGQSAQDLDMPLLTRNYVVSIYEVPSQQPIAAESFMSIGRHANGQLWTNSAVDGGISAGTLQTEGSFDLSNGNLVGRSALVLGAGTTVRGQAVNGNFDDLGVREAAFAGAANDQRSLSLAGNSGRVAFIPINRGLDYYQMSATPDTGTISPTTWNEYSRGANQCQMTITINEVEAATEQAPTRMVWTYQNSSGSESVVTLERGVNWPWPGQAGSETMPFQTEHLENGRDALVIHMELMEAYLASLGAASPTVNHSLVINVDDSLDPDVKMPEFPSASSDCCVVLRDCRDLSSYTKGFSLVTNMRLYIAGDFNDIAIPQPVGGGLTSGETFYPPVSLFAPEKRYGTTLKTRPVVYRGQVGSLAEGDAEALHPLDFKVGTSDTVSSALISTDLREITSPAELPPITLMNWLVTVEEIR
jgi:hypothetical protein